MEVMAGVEEDEEDDEEGDEEEEDDDEEDDEEDEEEEEEEEEEEDEDDEDPLERERFLLLAWPIFSLSMAAERKAWSCGALVFGGRFAT